jgi:hypothetical protein
MNKKKYTSKTEIIYTITSEEEANEIKPQLPL